MSLFTVLNTLFPLLFPQPARSGPNSTSTGHTLLSPSLGLEAFSASPLLDSSGGGTSSDAAAATAAATSAALAVPLVQGIQVPLDASLPWLGRCLAGADGW